MCGFDDAKDQKRISVKERGEDSRRLQAVTNGRKE